MILDAQTIIEPGNFMDLGTGTRRLSDFDLSHIFMPRGSILYQSDTTRGKRTRVRGGKITKRYLSVELQYRSVGKCKPLSGDNYSIGEDL